MAICAIEIIRILSKNELRLLIIQVIDTFSDRLRIMVALTFFLLFFLSYHY